MTIIGALRAAKAGEKVRKTAPFYSAVDEALANHKEQQRAQAPSFILSLKIQKILNLLSWLIVSLSRHSKPRAR
jgi:hypothetical protein